MFFYTNFQIESKLMNKNSNKPLLVKLFSKIKFKKKKVSKRSRSDFIERASIRPLFRGAIPLLPDMGSFVCCVSALDRVAPP